ncbi:MAG: ABC transporter substrate-binding protein [Acidimicrobiaceae bacterium]|nr:ABC transporter substrate-binding protein [Acidimicrobiaceae bacterium]
MWGTRDRTALVLIAAMGIVVAACSSSNKGAAPSGGGSGGHATSSPSCSSPGFSANSIKVGVIQQTTGNPVVVADFKNVEAAVKARFGVVNASGGINGRKLVTTAADDAGDAAQDLNASRQLVEQDGVFGIVQVSIEPGGGGAYLKAKGVPVTGWATASDPYATDNNFFGYNGSIPSNPVKQPSSTLEGFIKSKGITTMAYIGGTDPGSVAVTDGEAEAGRKVGLKVGYVDTNLQFGQKTFTGEIQRMKSAGVNGVLPEADPQTNLALIAAAKQAGLNATWFLTTGYDARLLAAASSLVQGDYFATQFAPYELNKPATVAMKDAFAKYAPGTPVNEATTIGYLSADLFVKGLEVSPKCPSRAAYIKALRGVHNYDAGGMIPPVNESTILGKGNPCFYWVKVVGKQFVPDSPNPYCGKDLKP